MGRRLPSARSNRCNGLPFSSASEAAEGCDDKDDDDERAWAAAHMQGFLHIHEDPRNPRNASNDLYPAIIVGLAQQGSGGRHMKEWQCVLVGNHKDIGKTIQEWEKNGWRLHTYACAGNAALTLGTNHYLLFERG